MLHVDINEFLSGQLHREELLFNWAKHNVIPGFTEVQEGGWEHWMQNSFFAWLAEYYGRAIVDMRREVGVYENLDQRVDWLFNRSATPDDPGPMFVVELKAQTPKHTRSGFLRLIHNDINKLTPSTKLKPDFRSARRICLVGVIHSSMEDSLTAEGFGPVVYPQDEGRYMFMSKEIVD